MCCAYCSSYQARSGGPQLAGAVRNGTGLCGSSTCRRTEANRRALALSREVNGSRVVWTNEGCVVWRSLPLHPLGTGRHNHGVTFCDASTRMGMLLFLLPST